MYDLCGLAQELFFLSRVNSNKDAGRGFGFGEGEARTVDKDRVIVDNTNKWRPVRTAGFELALKSHLTRLGRASS